MLSLRAFLFFKYCASNTSFIVKVCRPDGIMTPIMVDRNVKLIILNDSLMLMNVDKGGIVNRKSELTSSIVKVPSEKRNLLGVGSFISIKVSSSFSTTFLKKSDTETIHLSSMDLYNSTYFWKTTSSLKYFSASILAFKLNCFRSFSSSIRSMILSTISSSDLHTNPASLNN